MPVWNGEKYLEEAVNSILKQTFTDFEFIIIDDGSTDKTASILSSFRDPRIKIFTNEKNLGMAANFNRLIDLSCGEYMVRMDADDIALPKRIAVQVSFMEKHPAIGVCGSFVKNIGKGAGRIGKYFTSPSEINAGLLFSTSMAHPSVILRRSTFLRYNLRYDATFNPADDYDLWVRASRLTGLANIPKVLLLYRVHEGNITGRKAMDRKVHAEEIKLRQLQNIGLSPTKDELNLHTGIRAGDENFLRRLGEIEKWFLKIRTANQKSGLYEAAALEQVLGERWLLAAHQESMNGIPVWEKFRLSSLHTVLQTTQRVSTLKLFIKCLLRIH